MDSGSVWLESAATDRRLGVLMDGVFPLGEIPAIPRSDQVIAAFPPTAYNERIATPDGRLAVPVADVLVSLREAKASGGGDLFIPWDGHDPGRANAVTAHELAPSLRSRIEPAAPRGASGAPAVPGNSKAFH